MVSSILLQNFKWIALKLKKMNKGRRRFYVTYAYRENLNHGFSPHSTPRRQSFDWCFIMRHSYTWAEETKQINSLSYIDFLMTDFPERKALTVPFLWFQINFPLIL